MSVEITLPEWVYVPGQSPRHPPGAFDHLRASVSRGQSAESMGQSAAFLAGMTFLEAGFYWEAHEVLEPVWLALPPNSCERAFVQGLIQFANALLKRDMGRKAASERLLLIARDHLLNARAHEDAILLGVSVDGVIAKIDMHYNAISG